MNSAVAKKKNNDRGSIVYLLTRELACILTIYISVVLLSHGEVKRMLMNLLLTFLFILFSVIYEKKYRELTISYLFVFIIVYVIDTFFACYYDPINIESARQEHGLWIDDFYSIYFIVDLVLYIALILYAKLVKNVERKSKRDMSIKWNKYVFSFAILIFLYFVTKRNYSFLVPCYILSIWFIIFTNKPLPGVVGFILLCLIDKFSVIQTRYMLIEVLFPIGMMLMMRHSGKKKMGIIKANILFLLAVVAVGLYGVISEIYKLNTDWGGNYSVMQVLFDPKEFVYFFKKQSYRLFDIWIKLGGYIIYHVQANGLFYGLSYVKSLSGIFGFPYVSLPAIAAVYNQSTYAQPGLLAEGYANFGIVGAILNIAIVFVFMEILARHYLRKPNLFTLFIAIVPFSKILLDGGTLNSALFVLIPCVILFLPRFFSASGRNKKAVLNAKPNSPPRALLNDRVRD